MLTAEAQALPLEVVGTDQLEVGDVVLHYGMVLTIEESRSQPSYGGAGASGLVWIHRGVMQNHQEVLDENKRSPLFNYSWIKDGEWHIQGNELAKWCRIKKS